MTTEAQKRTTRLLNQLGSGDASVQEAIMAAVHSELQALARSSMRGWNTGSTLQPTALVHEAWIRLVDRESLHFAGRSQFYSLASRIMRGVLIDHLRGRSAVKRGGQAMECSLDLVDSGERAAAPSLDVLALEEALLRLEQRDPELGRLVELRFFGGLNHAEIAETLGTSLRTIERRWRQARAWLQAELDEEATT